MSQSIQAFTLGEIAVRQLNGLFSLNDLHRAAGAARRHEPARFIRLDGTKALIAELGAYPEMGTPSTDSQTPMRVINDGENNGTYACRELVIAYAAWISAAFHLKVIRVFLAAVQPQRPHNPAIDYDRISPAQAQDLKELVHAVVDAKVQGFGETWARLHKRFRVNSYLELPATRFEEARDYLLGKLPEQAQPSQPDTSRMQAAFDAAAQALEDWEQAVGAGGVSGPLMGSASLSANAGEPRKVFLVATGEEHEGEATYTRYDDKPPPLSDSECLFAAPPTAQAEGWTKPHRTITYTCPVCAASLERQE